MERSDESHGVLNAAQKVQRMFLTRFRISVKSATAEIKVAGNRSLLRCNLA